MWATLRIKILNFMQPITAWVGKQHLPFTHKLVTGVQYYEVLPKLKPGSVFLTHIRGELTNVFIPGFWTHAAMYTPNSTKVVDECVTQAVGIGVTEEDLVTLMTSKDYIIVLEPNLPADKKELIMKRAAELAVLQLGKPYDYDFDFQISEQKSFYCSELIWWCYDRACAEYGVPSLFVLGSTFGQVTVTPDEVSTKANFSIIYATPGSPS